MKKLLLNAMIASMAVSAMAETELLVTNTWFDAKIDTYCQWPTNDVQMFGGEWVNTESATLSADGLEIDSSDENPLSFLASTSHPLSEGEVMISGIVDMKPFEIEPEVPTDAKAAICVVNDGGDTSTYRVLAFDALCGSNVWLNTGFQSVSQEGFRVYAKAQADFAQSGRLSVRYVFGDDKACDAQVYIGGQTDVVSQVSFCWEGTLHSLSASKIEDAVVPEPPEPVVEYGLLDASCYAKKLNVTFTGVQSGLTLTNFPALVRLSTAIPGFSYSDFSLPDGGGIRFSDADGNLIPHEIDTWDESGVSTVWVRVPALTYNTVITAHYGFNGEGELPAVDPKDVWDDDYVGVWHLGERELPLREASKTSSDFSVAYGDSIDYATNGVVGGSVGFPAGGLYNSIVAPDHDALDGFDKFTIETWIFQDEAKNNAGILSKRLAYNREMAYYVFESIDSEVRVPFCVGTNRMTGAAWAYNIHPEMHQWNHLAISVDMTSNSSNVHGFNNGVLGSWVPSMEFPSAMPNCASDLVIGNLGANAAATSFSGRIDEVRISKTVRSPDWMKATHDTIANQDFASYQIDGFEYGRLDTNAFVNALNVVFPGVRHGVALTNFPVLVRLSEAVPGFSYLGFNMPHGGDLRFSDADGNLIPHEIDTWDESGVSAVWVKVPVLARDSMITAHYGCQGTPDAVNPKDVWDDDYLGVWHLNENSDEMACSADGGGPLEEWRNGTKRSAGGISPAQPGIVGNSVMFGCSDDRKGCLASRYSNCRLSGREAFTVELWSCQDDHAPGEAEYSPYLFNEIGKNEGGSISSVAIRESKSSNGRIVDTVSGEAGANVYLNPSSSMPPPARAQWHHLVFCYDASATCKNIQDGSIIAAAAGIGAVCECENPTLYVGNHDSGNILPFPGKIDEVRISKTSRSEDWIKATYDTITDNGFCRCGVGITPDEPEGMLYVHVQYGATNVLDAALVTDVVTNIVKTGGGTLIATPIPEYSGDISIEDGIWRCTAPGDLGATNETASSGAIYVKDGASIEFAPSDANSKAGFISGKTVHLYGAPAYGMYADGKIVLSTSVYQQSPGCGSGVTIILHDDATFVARSGRMWLNGVLDLGGKSLALKYGQFDLGGMVVNGGSIKLAYAIWRTDTTTVEFDADSADKAYIELDSGSTFGIKGRNNAVAANGWTIRNNGGVVTANYPHGPTETDVSMWEGPVVFSGDSSIANYAKGSGQYSISNTVLNLKGPVSGSGTLSGGPGWINLFSAENTYSGAVVVSGKSTNQVANGSTSCSVLPGGGGIGVWNGAALFPNASSVTFCDSARVEFMDGTAGTAGLLSFIGDVSTFIGDPGDDTQSIKGGSPDSRPTIAGIAKTSANVLVVDSTAHVTGTVAVSEGTLRIPYRTVHGTPGLCETHIMPLSPGSPNWDDGYIWEGSWTGSGNRWPISHPWLENYQQHLIYDEKGVCTIGPQRGLKPMINSVSDRNWDDGYSKTEAGQTGAKRNGWWYHGYVWNNTGSPVTYTFWCGLRTASAIFFGEDHDMVFFPTDSESELYEYSVSAPAAKSYTLQPGATPVDIIVWSINAPKTVWSLSLPSNSERHGLVYAPTAVCTPEHLNDQIVAFYNDMSPANTNAVRETLRLFSEFRDDSSTGQLFTADLYDPGDEAKALAYLPVFERLAFAPGTTLDLSGNELFTVKDIVGTPEVVNAPALEISGNWTILASDLANREGLPDHHPLTVDGRLVFAPSATFAVEGDVAALDVHSSGTLVATASGGVEGELPVSLTPELSLAVSEDGKSLLLFNVESNPNLRKVQFDLGDYGSRVGGGGLLQYVVLGRNATAPSVRASSGWVFDGWSRPFTNITENISVTANYRSAYADLYVDAIDVTNMVASGESLNLRWIVGNTGNPSFNGRMTERISLVSASDENDVRVIASPVFEGSIARDGSVERNLAIDIPLKGWEGVWYVRIETAVSPSVQEYAVNNVTTTDTTLEIVAVPLSNLKADAVSGNANLVPGETAMFTFATTNSGAAAASAPWMDRIYLESVDSGIAVKVGDISRTNDLDPASAINGEYALTIPEFISVAGAVRVKVVANANGDVVESDDDDNVAYSVGTFSLATNLYLTAASTSVYENVSGSGVRFTVRRSGPITEAMTVALSATLGGSPSSATVNCPESVTIPAGSVSTVFYVKPIDNATVEGPRTAVVSASAGDCRPVSLELTILDNEVPKLTVTLDKTSIREGDGVILATVTRELVTDEPLTVYLTGASTSRCSYPSSVTIPAGESSVTFEISVPNNDTAQAAASLTLRASSSGYTSTSVSYTVEDDDVPGVTLSLTPEVVSEGAGAQAIYATLTRSDTNQIAQAVRVRLTASEANRLILPSEITIPKYTMAVRFAVGVVDNALDDGDREIDIDGAIVIESCGCNGQSSNGDVIHATVGIIDNDGPALALKADPTTMKEGFDPAGYLVLSHNSTLTDDLTVRLWVDAENEDEIVIPETVTIHAGETSVRIPVTTLDDGVEDGGQLVSVYVEDESDVFAPASTWVQVSDQNLPDLTVAKVETVASVVAMENFTTSFAVTNTGFMATSKAIPYAVHLVKGANANAISSATLVKSGTLTGGIDVGDALYGTVTLTAPEMPGDYRVAVVVDPDGTISELDSANNTGWSSAIGVTVAYTATAGVDKKIYMPGEVVTITGVVSRADGTTAGNVQIDPYVMLSGMRRSLLTTTAADGSYSATFTPTSGEAGDYSVGSCYPGVNSKVAQDSFSIIGMKRSSTANVIWDIALGDSATRTVTIQNRSAVPLTGLTATFTDVPEECGFTYSLPDSIPANGSVTLSMSATADGLTDQVDYRKFYAHLAVDEGLTLDFPLYFHSQAQRAYLRATPTSINTTMAIGQTRYIEATLVNDGKGDSGAVSVSVPDVNWLKIVSGASIDNLASGESATITLAISPTAEDGLTLNSPLSGGRMAVNCANGTGCSVSLKFTPVSEATGSITVDAVDNNTYTLESAPHLSNATVRVSNPYTGATVATGKTGTDGIWTASNIPEGTYQLTITAPNHDSYADAITVEPGRDSNVEAFLQYQIVTATWTVERTEIEDSYDIQLLLDFETQVPAPIVNTIMPTDFPTLNEGESWSFTVTLQNTGVIAAEKVTVVMPEIEGYTFTLSDNDVAVPAKSSVDITGVFSRPRKTRSTNLLRASVTVVTTVSCTYREKTIVVYPCGKEHPEYSYEKIIRHGECEASTLVYITDDNWNPGSGGGGGTPVRIVGPGGGGAGPGGFSVGPGSTYAKKDCNVCLAEKKAALDNCRARFNDIVDYLNAIIDRRKVSNSDCIGSAPLFTGSVTLPNQDRKYGDLATDVYGNGEVDIEKSGYRPMTEAEVRSVIGDSYWIFNGRIADTSGLKAWLYVDKDTPIGSSPSNVFLVFAGTEHADDWMENVKNGVCTKTGQYETASSLLQSVLSGFAGQIHVIGHSLGGGLTQYAMLTNDLDGRVDGTTFNSAGLCESSVPDLDHCNAAASAIRNFRALNDPVSFIGHHLGPIYTVGGADGHFISYFGSNPPEVGYWSSIGWSFGSGAALWIDLLKDKIDDLKNYYNYGIDGGAIVAAIENCLSRLLSTCDEYDSPYSIADIFDEAALGRLKTKSLEGIDSELSAQLEKLQVLPLAIAGDLAVKGNLFGGIFKKGGAITKVDTWLKVKERTNIAQDSVMGKKAPVVLASTMDSDEEANKWLQVDPSDLVEFLEAVATYDEISLDQMISIKPEGVSDLAVENFYFRMTNTVAAIQANSFSGIDCIDLEQMYRGYRVLKTISEYVYGSGYNDFKSFVNDTFDRIEQNLIKNSEAVCATVTLQLSQSVSMTREAFNGTLTMYNGNTQTPITALKMVVSVTDEDGNECKDRFVMNDLGNNGATSGGYILDGGLTVAAGGTGSSIIQFIPERRAAETESKLYKFGGTITYIDPFSGELATINLTPVALTVNPSPYLHLDYFVQRDVFADDPFTPDVVEASMPAELAVLVRNIGGGNANKVTIASAQPEMVQNEKGLSAAFNLRDYSLEASALNGATAHLGLNTVSLGTIEPNESKVAQWWLTSTIEGHFIGMSATVTPVNSWNTPDTALVDPNVGVHKLVRSIVADGDTLPDFLVCDGSDLYGTPNEIYTAHGDQLPVYVAAVSASAALSAGSEIELPISLTPTQSGWNYGYAEIPGIFRYTISRIVRGDGSEIPLRNAWITDRTFRDSNTPLIEDRLHIVDEFASNAVQAYTAYLTAKPSDVPEVAAFEGVTDGLIEYVARNAVTVVFSKPIDQATFTVDDLTLVKQGAYLNDLSALTITPADDSGTRFTIGNLSALCSGYGRYELTVRCAGIADTVGQLGTVGKSVAWTYATAEAPYVIGADGVPVRPVQSLDTISVTFSAPIKPETFTSAALRMNGVAVGSGVTIAALDASGTRFSVSGLSSTQTSDGEYTLVIDATAVAGLDDTPGVNTYPATWTRDTVAPVLQSLAHADGLNGNEFTLTFSENVTPESLTPGGATIKRNGASVALPATASLRRVGDNAPYQYVLSGIDSALAEDGTYELCFSADGVTDEAGNVASGSKSVSWTVDRTPPAQITDLAISPDGGFSDTDGITYTGALTVSGTLPEAGLTVEIIAKYVGGSETVLATLPTAGGDSLPAGAFSQNIVMPGTGNATLVVRLTDAAGNSSDSEKSVSVDGIALTGALTGASEDEGVVTTTAALVFSAKPMESDVTFDKFALTRDGEAVALEGVTFAKVDDTTFTLTGLDALCSEDGVYVLTFNGAAVRKYTSGLLMNGSPVMRWRYENPDREPPTVTEVLFDGETPYAAYTNVFSSVSVTFSEAVNVPELIEKGLIGRVARMELLDAGGVVTGCVAAARSESAPYQWNAESNTLSWQIDPAGVPAGRARLMLDAGLIKDLAGNGLAVDENGQAARSTNGLRTYALSETVMAQVNAQAMPMWCNDELFVGEKTADNKGKIRHYAANGTWSYLQSDGVDIEIPAQGCQGASVAFADMDGDGAVETYIGTTGGDVLKYPGGAVIASLGANRAMPYTCDIDGDGCDELVVGGMDGKIRVVALRRVENNAPYQGGSQSSATETYEVTVLTDVNGSALTVPNGRAAPVVADINHDGLADIVSGDTAGNVWAFLGEGAAWCAAPFTVFTNNVSLADRSRLGYGDVNGDGIDDLIVGRSDGSVTAMLGVETPSPVVPFAVKAVVSASAGTHGAIAPVGDATYDGGDTPKYTITPDVGYHVSDVQIDGVSIGATNNYVFAPLTTSHEIHADFVVTPYAITYAGLKGATNTNPETYTVEDEITFTAPGEVYGWVFKGWTPASIALGNTGTIEVTANWERAKFDVTVNGGTTQYDYEAEVTFTAPEPWDADGMQVVTLGTTFTDPVVTNEFTVTVTNGIEFAWDILATNWWFEVSETQNGSITAPEAGWMADGTNFTLVAVPAEHYHFVGWTGDTNGCAVADGALEVTMDQARTIGAVFAIDAFTVTFEASAHGTLSGETAQAIDYGGTAAVPTVTPDAGYTFAGWSGETAAPIVSNATFTAQYATVPYKITYAGLKGATNTNPETYTVEDEIAFTAPGEVYGWVFKGWTPASIALGSTGAIEVSANWERAKFDVTVNGETTQYDYEAEVTFTTNAIISAGVTQYVCKGWAATNADPAAGDGANAKFKVLGDVSFAWLWETNVVTLAQSVNAEGFEWTTGGAADWQPEWSDAANDGLHHAHSGAIGNNTNSWIETSVEGAGTLSFVWKSSTEARYDMFQFIVDGEVKGTISGETPWTTNTIVLAGGAHTFRWNYRKSRSGTAGADMVWLDSVTWTADVPPTLAEALNPDLFWMTDGDVEWTAVRKDTILDPHDDWATVGGLSDYESSLVGTEVYGAGVLTFDWAVSCEDGYDWFDFIADGEIRESITGETGWKTVTIEFKTAGKHVLQWEYWKDDMDEAELVGDNRARLDNVKWTPASEESQYTTTTPDPVPFAEIRTSYSNYWQAAEGDYEAAAHMVGHNGCAIWESYVAGLVPDDEDSKFTAKIEMLPDGTPKVTWEPDNEALRATRTYTTYGKKTLLDRDWTPVTDANKNDYNFFKVEVKMK